MAVELPADVQERGEELGEGVAYALRVLARQLEDDPLLGSPTSDPSGYVARIDGEVFEDCPDLNVYYAYGPPLLEEGQVRIRRVEAVRQAAGEPEQRGAVLVPDPGRAELEVRQVTGAWLRIEAWLREHAPVSYASLRAGASGEEISGLEGVLGVRIPAGLKALWRLRAGVDGGAGAVFLLENWALMSLDSVISFHERQMWSQQRDGGSDLPLWKAAWIPVCSFGADDQTYGLYLDAETGQLCTWDRYGERRPAFDSLTTYLEEMADALEAPSLVTGARPGLAHGGLAWGPPADPDIEAAWVPFTG
ncbi:SMI1/KNR4 family protein [Streptomyces sp. CAU 1734]|uniref:SMI1/KNR4 family protein n=1 Tax=Streptomyces sp. CAU 1734 TaxID=3140360 RepID=UPI00325FE10B